MCHYKNLKQHTTLRMGTFNLRGINDINKQRCLWRDIAKYKIDLCCLQETKLTEATDENFDNCRFINIGTESRHYGNGFVVSSEWSQNIVRYWKVSDRISVIQLRLKDDNTYTCKCISQREGIWKLKIQRKEKNLLSVINVYAPTTSRVDSNPNERTEFYTDLSTTMQEVKKKSCLVLIGGDFNAKIGKQPERDEMCVGRFSRGRRNIAGQQLIDFCNMK